MADIYQVYDIIVKMVDGFEPEVVKRLGDNVSVAETAVREQMYSGLDGDEHLLSPDYDTDPYFEERGWWYHRADAYKAWKRTITPPAPGVLITLPPRPDNVPNLYINGKFFGEVFAYMQGDCLSVSVQADGAGPDIVAKYGEQLLRLGPTSIGYINTTYIKPHIWQYFADCGYTP